MRYESGFSKIFNIYSRHKREKALSFMQLARKIIKNLVPKGRIELPTY